MLSRKTSNPSWDGSRRRGEENELSNYSSNFYLLCPTNGTRWYQAQVNPNLLCPTTRSATAAPLRHSLQHPAPTWLEDYPVLCKIQLRGCMFQVPPVLPSCVWIIWICTFPWKPHGGIHGVPYRIHGSRLEGEEHERRLDGRHLKVLLPHFNQPHGM